MKPGTVSFLVLVVAPALSAPNPFRLPSIFGGGNQVNPYPPQPLHHYYPPPPPPPPAGPHPSPGEPAASPAQPTSAKEPWITMPFAPALNAPFYVPTIFAPHTTSSAPVPSVQPGPVTVTVPALSNLTTTPSLLVQRRGSNLRGGNAPATPLPTPPPANRQA